MSQRIPSLFKVARHKKFNYEPMYYDPIREEIKEREGRIKREMQLNNGEIPEGYVSTASNNIRGSFRQNRSKQKDSTGMIRALIFVILGGGFVAFLYLGQNSLYLLLLFIPLYILIRKKKLFKS